MPKVNAIIGEDVREQIRSIAVENGTTVQAVVERAIRDGLKGWKGLQPAQLGRRLPKDGRKARRI